jgi:hypothetical protein
MYIFWHIYFIYTSASHRLYREGLSLMPVQLLWNPKTLKYIHKNQSVDPGPVELVESSLHLHLHNYVLCSHLLLGFPNGLFVYWQVRLDHLCGLVVWVPGYRFRGLRFDSRRYQIFWEVVVLERGPLSLMSTIEELLGRNSSGSSLENREYGHGNPLRWPRDTLYPQKLALTSPTCGGRSFGIVRLWTKTMALTRGGFMEEKPPTMFAFPQFLSLHLCCPHRSSICNIISHLVKPPQSGLLRF